MKSICIKTNNNNFLLYLLNELHLSKINNICFSKNEFKNYKNIIIHYNGTELEKFYKNISKILAYLVIDECEEILLKTIINHNYCYFNNKEKTKILNFCFDISSEDFSKNFNEKISYISNSFYMYLKKHKTIILSGFIYFRLPKYFKLLNELVEEAVNSFIIEKEYIEFISLVKLYINSQNNKSDIIHLVYLKNNSFLLDENKNIIPLSCEILNNKFLSDISFSKNDYILNTLLNLIPKKIYIHLIDNNIDEFINTLILIFEQKIKICTDCNICNLYKNNKNLIPTKK